METKNLLKILILEDSKEDIFLIKRELNKSNLEFHMMEVDEKQEFIDSLLNFNPDIILSDHSLPQFNSLEALNICQAYNRDLPFILVTGTVSEEFAAQCIKNGADDYVLKSNLKRLATSIEQSIRHRNDEKMRREAEVMLREQNHELIKINGELDSFVYNISHNLRAPLLSLMGLVNLAKMEVELMENDLFREYLLRMDASAKKLDHTLLEILDYSKNSRSELAIEKIDLKYIIEECFHKIKYLVEINSIRNEIDFVQQSEFASDVYRLNVILLNLISNAVKYQDASKKNKIITVKVHVTLKDATIEVTDNGIGIEKKNLENVFKMFYRASTLSDGSGLGLYIVRESVDKVGGKVEVASEIGVGTTFKLSIPNKISLI